jgi:hypothetical protein
MPGHDEDNLPPPPNYQFHVPVLSTPGTEEIVPHVEMGVNPHIGLA